MFVSFCHKLDALCNFHYTPKAPAVEIEVVKNVPAISMEEVLPTAVNDRVMKAPEEIYNKKHGRCVCVCMCAWHTSAVCCREHAVVCRRSLSLCVDSSSIVCIFVSSCNMTV